MKALNKQQVLDFLSGRHARGELALATVSGVATTKSSMITYFDTEIAAIDLITTKSFQVTPNPGNREPILVEPETGSFGNSVGLKNPGMEVALREIAALRENRTLRALLNISLSASNPEDFITLVKAFAPYADILELNFSCPHASAGFGASIGCSEEIASDYMKKIREAVGAECPALIFPKLTPNVDDIGAIAKALVLAGADGFSAINTVGPVVHYEPVSGKPVLQNKLGGKGGKSGTWIRKEALQAVSAVRSAVGPALPIIGMGGVSTGIDAAAMLRAGADCVGIGSAFGMVHQRDWAAYTEAVRSEASALLQGMVPWNTQTSRDNSICSSFLEKKNAMEYKPFTVKRVTDHTDAIKIIELDGELACGPGQFAFVWIPGIGEKPFSIAETKPLTFIVKKRGAFTEAFCAVQEGQQLFVRGVYGECVEPAETEKAVILAGGTGIAVIPSLVSMLQKKGVAMQIFVGTSEAPAEGKNLLEDELSRFGTFCAVADAGIPGRVLANLADDVKSIQDTAFYAVGPEIFMAKAARIMQEKGIPDDRIFLSLERPSLCGIGMCGECACGGRLTCQYGTFVRYDFIKREAPELL